jgi:hypothetical protein
MKDLEIPTVHYMLLGLAYHKNEVGGEYSTYRISFQNPVWKITTWGTKPFVKRFVHLNDPNSFSVKLILACSFSSAHICANLILPYKSILYPIFIVHRLSRQCSPVKLIELFEFFPYRASRKTAGFFPICTLHSHIVLYKQSSDLIRTTTY